MTFHWYGFIVGLAVSIVLRGLEYQYHHSTTDAKVSLSGWQLVGILLTMLLGARLWHVVSDWQLYGQFNWQLLAVWQGGLSILGALLAGAVAVWWLVPTTAQRIWLLDALALWLPLGQAVGRLANWINQELYGLPTTVSWSIFIDSEHRLPGFEQFSFFHPLFAYEVIGLVVLAGLLWLLHSKRHWQLGAGKLVVLYLQGYIWLRYWLDFLRIDRSQEWFGLGLNQWVLLVIGFGMVSWLLFKNRTNRFVQRWMVGAIVMVMIIGLGSVRLAKLRTSWLEQAPVSSRGANQITVHYLLAVSDRSIQQIKHHDRVLSVVVVNTNSSRQQGLSGTTQVPAQGMLFVFNRPDAHLFWMKDMRYSLDFIWFRDGRVVDLQTQIPAPSIGSSESQLPQYSPKEPADMMLEVAAGTVRTDSWQIGDTIQFVPITEQ